jgi:hypothetical protein
MTPPPDGPDRSSAIESTRQDDCSARSPALRGWWWLDPIIGVVIAVEVGEGRAAWRGEDCC